MSQRLLLDRLGADGNPPLEQVEVSGWRLRASAGVLLRANSALPLSDARPLDAVIEFYRSRDLPPRVHVSSSALDDALAALGWRREFEVLVMSGPVPTGPSSAVIATALDVDWLDCWWAVDGRGGPAEQDVFRRMSARVPAPSAYASIVVDGRTVAVGRGVAQEGVAGRLRDGGAARVAGARTRTRSAAGPGILGRCSRRPLGAPAGAGGQRARPRALRVGPAAAGARLPLPHAPLGCPA